MGILDPLPDNLVSVRCGKCSIEFGMPRGFYNTRHQDGETWYCPNGHARCFAESELQKTKRLLANAQKRTEWAESDARRAREQRDRSEARRRAAKGQLTKTKRRIAAGTCPGCSATFPDVAAHIAEHHPDLVEP